MLLNGIPFERIWKTLHAGSSKGAGVISFVRFIEKRLGAMFLYDAERVPFGRPGLLDLFELAEALKNRGVIKRYEPAEGFCDEPRSKAWRAECAIKGSHMAGGIAVSDDRAALTAALAEALERYIWFEKDDYFKAPRRATARMILQQGAALLPERFAGFSEDQRGANTRLTLRPDAEYLWVCGISHTRGGPLWVPAQAISGLYGGANMRAKDEPLIASPITTGLATGPTREFALLGGALEIIERDAFMITWLNQLTPLRADLAALAVASPSLATLLKMCTRYRLSVEAALLPTDAPAYAVCGIVKDESAEGPAVTIGLKAHRDLARAIEGALLEALRMRQTIRSRRKHEKPATRKNKDELNHLERLDYWASAERLGKLDFLSSGAVVRPREAWERDSEKEHLARIIEWCRANDYEFASVDLGASRANVSPWHIRMVVIPELQPIHQNEKLPCLGGERLKSVPAKLGCIPRAVPFTEEPHPFA